jgi:type III pantothenate kinase
MIFLVDAGNTRVKIGWLWRGQREPQPLAAGLNDLQSLAPQLHRLYAAHLAALTDTAARAPGGARDSNHARGGSHSTFASGEGAPGAQKPAGAPTAPAAIGVSSAGSQTMQALNAVFERTLGCSIHWHHSSGQAAGMLSLYQPPEQLGPDRWAAMLGMMPHVRQSQGPVLLATFGTATTVDTLVPAHSVSGITEQTEQTAQPLRAEAPPVQAVFLGGLILPGHTMMLQSLAQGTARLPVASGTPAPFPTHTHQAIYTGVVAAQTGAVLRQWQGCLAQFGVAPQVYCSGGNWPAVEPEVQQALAQAQQAAGQAAQPAWFVQSPVLDGLAVLAEQP